MRTNVWTVPPNAFILRTSCNENIPFVPKLQMHFKLTLHIQQIEINALMKRHKTTTKGKKCDKN
jgi:hypothetical protein